MTTRLSVNVNKIATLRNSRGGNLPDLVAVARDCEAFGAQGITVHPRPDERHIRYADVPMLKAVVTTEYNIEGYPSPDFIDLVLANQPDQCTLVPDAPGVLTSSQGWDTIRHAALLRDVTQTLQAAGIRVSVFVDADAAMVEGAKAVGADRIEFYTGHFAHAFAQDPALAVADHVRCGKLANEIGLGINAGHDLNLDNLAYYCRHVPQVLEVSIGHALISDALYLGLETTIGRYLAELRAAADRG